MINSRRLIELRGDRSQREIEAETGISQSTISGWESGEAKRPDTKKLRRLADFYRVPLSDIYVVTRRFEPDDQMLSELVLTWTELHPLFRQQVLSIARVLAGQEPPALPPPQGEDRPDRGQT
jgi:transcriptional regulator with XRE-family HTH domain